MNNTYAEYIIKVWAVIVLVGTVLAIGYVLIFGSPENYDAGGPNCAFGDSCSGLTAEDFGN